MNSNDFIEVLKNKKDDIIVPESLRPESIRMLIESVEVWEDNTISMDVRRASRNGRRKLIYGMIATIGVAAVIVLMLLAEPFIRHNFILDKYLNTTLGGVLQPKSYDKLSEYLKQSKLESDRITFTERVNGFVASILSLSDEPMYGGSMGNMHAGTSYSNSNHYSESEVKAQGVKESDWVGNNGKYIYILNEGVLKIYLADNENTDCIASRNVHLMIRNDKTFDNLGYVDVIDMLLYDEKLIFIGKSYDDDTVVTIVALFDISDVSDVRLVDVSKIEGEYRECRMQGEYLYVCAMYDYSDYALDSIISKVDGREIEATRVFVAADDDYKSSYTMTSYHVDYELELSDCIAIVNDGNIDAYVTEENIYLLSKKYYECEDYIGIIKLRYSNGSFDATAATQIKGWIDSIYCVDEYNDDLRMVVTNGSSKNSKHSLYVFDEMLNKKAMLKNLANDKEITMVSFHKGTGYIATEGKNEEYILYTVDLSNGNSIRICDKFKTRGAVKYIANWKDELMLAIIDIEGGSYMAMLNAADICNVSEESGKELEEIFNPSVFEDYKTVYMDQDKGYIGFAEDGNMHSYYVWTYENTDDIRFKELLRIDCCKQADADGVYYDSYMTGSLRGIQLEEYLYVVCRLGKVHAVNMENR